MNLHFEFVDHPINMGEGEGEGQRLPCLPLEGCSYMKAGASPTGYCARQWHHFGSYWRVGTVFVFVFSTVMS